MKISLLLLILALNAQAAPVVGNKAAGDYFVKRRNSASVQARKNQDSHLMMLHLGTHIKDNSYNWGKLRRENIGTHTAGVSYKIGEWVNSSDLLIRFDFNRYEIGDESAQKISIMPVITFPDQKSYFPLYFGAGAGAGIFYEQLKSESNISIDYTIFVGGRYLNPSSSVGVFAEYGVKNHVHLLSDGQFNSTFFSAGTIFSF